jgi:hypothetical protein
MKTEAERKRKSPTEVLLSKWARHGHNVTELFKLLANMQHYPAMEILKTSVPEPYHIWIRPNITVLLKSQKDSAKINNENAQPSQIFKSRRENDRMAPKNDIKENLNDLLNIPEIPVDELAAATSNWADSNILGKGGFGVVYRGILIIPKLNVKLLILPSLFFRRMAQHESCNQKARISRKSIRNIKRLFITKFKRAETSESLPSRQYFTSLRIRSEGRNMPCCISINAWWFAGRKAIQKEWPRVINVATALERFKRHCKVIFYM